MEPTEDCLYIYIYILGQAISLSNQRRWLSGLIRQVIPPEKGVSDLVSSRSPLGVLMSSLVPDNWATDERRGTLRLFDPSC